MTAARRSSRVARRLGLVLAILATLPGASAQAESGYDLWLRYVPIDDTALRDAYRRSVTAPVVPHESPTGRLVLSELQRGVKGLLGTEVPVSSSVDADGAVVSGTPTSVPAIAALGWAADLEPVGHEGYIIRPATIDRHPVIVG